MNVSTAEFGEIAHSGGKLTISVRTGAPGSRKYQLRWEHCRPNFAAMFAVWALPQGIVVRQAQLGGIGSPQELPPVPGAWQVFIGSDSEGLFGRKCPNCGCYWRSDVGATVCPNCASRGEVHEFLTDGQRSYVAQYCAKMREALNAEADGDCVIDLDAVADASGQATEKPPFYYAEKSQQNKFTCEACGGFNDILGTFGYCSRCGTRNDIQELSGKTVPQLRERIKSGGPYEACVRDAVSAFDSLAGRYAGQLLTFVPVTPARRARFENRRFHHLESVARDFREVFDIDILAGLEADDIEFAKLMFYRRHVYEHQGGEADERYITESGDQSVVPRQALHESMESAHRTLNLILKMARNLHNGFHQLLPAEAAPIEFYERNRARSRQGS